MENISAVNKFSGYIMWKPMAGETTDHVVKALMEVFATHGHCKKIKMDGGPAFRNSFQEDYGRSQNHSCGGISPQPP